MGHVLGFGHESGLTVMQDGLETGVRRLVGENGSQVENGVIAAAADTTQALTKPNQAAAAGADYSSIFGRVGAGTLIDWTDHIPGNGRTIDPSFTLKNKLSWVKGFLADHELEVTLPGPRT
jgi:hypothetical protein